MRYLLMDYVNEAGWPTLTRAEQEQWLGAYRAYMEAMTKAGVLGGSNGLQPSLAATTIRLANGKRQVLDGVVEVRSITDGTLLTRHGRFPGAGVSRPRAPIAAPHFTRTHRRSTMPRLAVFNQVTLDGYFAALNGDIGWAHKDSGDEEWNAFVAGNATAGGVLLFGRLTYELMAGYWPTPQATENTPESAERMNNLPKGRVFEDAGQAVMGQHDAGEGRHGGGSTKDEERARARPGDSGKRQHCLATGARGCDRRKTRAFGNGNVLLCYEPMA